MTIEIPALSPAAGRAVLIGAAAITLGSVAASELVTFLISHAFNLNADGPAYLVAGIIPLLLAGPGSYFQLKRLEQVREAYRELERVSSTDWLTGCLNRRAFIAGVSVGAKVGRPGALLLIDADGFKTINDRHGHDRGDDALRRIVTVINESVGSSDLVGRLGGEEFGVYLRDATDRHASAIAEAIREGVADIAFASGDDPHALTVSVGVVTITAPIAFCELFQIAENQLASAKANGRNRVAITAAETVGSNRAAA
ncbi:MAG: GGDEF domain-containing protein [Devosia sp.]